MLPKIQEGFHPSVVGQIKSKLSRGSKTKAASSASNKPPTLTIKEEPG
ncbi:hypothetical protein A2U01_0084289, partial [Trifolium medium]|nr:hypothetical protein [Trifolium medium]